MRPSVPPYNSVFVLLLASVPWTPSCAAASWVESLSRRFDLVLDYSPAPSPEDGPPASAGALRDPAFLPAQIGGIVGAYALSLVLVALLLLALSKRRRERLRNLDRAVEEDALYFSEFNPFPDPFLLQAEEDYKRQLEEFQQTQQLEQIQLRQVHPQQLLQYTHFQNPSTQTLSLQIPVSPRNFSHPAGSPLSPTRVGHFSPAKSQRSAFTAPSPTSTVLAPGVDLSVDQAVVGRDRNMAQSQLEEMYKHVMEQEQAKAEGREYHPPQLPSPLSSNPASAGPARASGKKERVKPAGLNLVKEDKESRSSSLFSFLKSPRKNKMGAAGMSISSPIMTPMSGTFPRHDDQEMNPIQPRHYAPPAPPPVSSDLPFRRAAQAGSATTSQLPTPDISPVSTQSIDSRIDAAIGQPPARISRREQQHQQREAAPARFPPVSYTHMREMSSATTTPSIAGDHEPASASSEKSTSNLVGLPVSPRPNVTRFPSDISLPASPRPHQQSFTLPTHHNATNASSTASFPRPSGASATGSNAPSAVREGGALPLRAYEPSISSPTATSFATTTKQTVFTRGPMSPGGGAHDGMQTGMRTPWTGAPVPYTPYQPFSPVVPITPSVVTKADRKRMKRLEPRTPTVEMVRSQDDIW
ncbi:uncharacterized protein C8A04DRAFT_39367 [Dichotomopilus funicola]|uniref:Uncharacterized protein n=1 Tax=Dichotomopilus funicola TaxID=1934379 RepID=A0AAN6UXT0_9PEZI|nr:hypothetical protein C8A04DRAFT_39367 [Dichotomopilus funicola]